MKHAPVIPILEHRHVGRWFVHGLVPFLLGAATSNGLGDVILAANPPGIQRGNGKSPIYS